MRTKSLLLGALTLLAAATMAGCTKEAPQGGTPQDPMQEKITRLRTDSVRLAGEVRAAVDPAKYEPNAIVSTFNENFGYAKSDLLLRDPENLLDSAKVFTRAIEIMWRDFGKPTPLNAVTIQTLYDKSGAYVSVSTELEQLLYPPHEEEINGTTGSLSWAIGLDRVLTISGNGAMPDYNISDNRAPWFGEYGAYRAKFDKVTIGEGVTTIGDCAFYICTSFTSITIPSSVTTIGSRAFEECCSLTCIEVDASNPNYTSEGGVLFNKNKTELIQYPGGKSGAYVIPNSVTTIGYYAFSYCAGLTSVTIPDGVTKIAMCAFTGCTGLKDVIIMATTPPELGSDNFSRNYSDTLHVPAGCVAAYEAAEAWRAAFTNIVEQQ
jgi:hypothetical protein